MPITKRQQIIDAIIARMRTISQNSGYQTFLGENVGDWQTNWDESELPALSVCDGLAQESLIHDEPTAKKQINLLPIFLKIFIRKEASEYRAANLRLMIADVKKAINQDRFWTVENQQLALWTKPKNVGLEIDEKSFEIGGAMVEIEIAYLTDSFDEYD